MPSINERMTALESLTTENNKTLWRIHEAIYGNGKPGLLAEVRVLAQSVEQHHAEHRQRKIDWQWLVTTLIAVAAVLAVWGAMQTVYALECIRLSKRTGDA